MVSLNPSDFLSDDGSPALPFLLSVRSQSLLLAAATEIQDRSSWDEMDDATWDEIEGAVSEAITEIMEEVEPDESMVDNALYLERVTSQTVAAATDVKVLWDDEIYDYGGLHAGSGDIYIPDLANSGLYLMNIQISLGATTSTFKTAWVQFSTGLVLALDQRVEAAAVRLHCNRLISIGAGETISVYVRSGLATTVQASSGTDSASFIQMTRLRTAPIG